MANSSIAAPLKLVDNEAGSMSWLSGNIEGFIRDVMQPMTLAFHIQDPETKDEDLISMIAGMRAEDASYTLPERINKDQDSDANVDRKQGLLLQALRSIDPAHSKRGFHKKHVLSYLINGYNAINGYTLISISDTATYTEADIAELHGSILALNQKQGDQEACDVEANTSENGSVALSICGRPRAAAARTNVRRRPRTCSESDSDSDGSDSE
jgi:hypothetical protein